MDQNKESTEIEESEWVLQLEQNGWQAHHDLFGDIAGWLYPASSVFIKQPLMEEYRIRGMLPPPI